MYCLGMMAQSFPPLWERISACPGHDPGRGEHPVLAKWGRGYACVAPTTPENLPLRGVVLQGRFRGGNGVVCNEI